MTVSGQVEATGTKSDVHNFPSDVDLAKVIFPLPQQVHGKFLVSDSTGIKPVHETGQLIKLFVDHNQDLFKLKGQLGIVEMDTKHPYAGGAKFKEEKKFLKDRVFVLHDRNDVPVAVTAVDGSVDYVNACIIYGTTPLVDQDSSAMNLVEEGVTFFPWFRAVDDHPSYTSVDYWDGDDFKPFIRAHPDKQEGAVGLLIKSASGHHTLGHLIKMKRGDKHGWDVTIAPGVDPAMILCITAAMEELFGGGNSKWENVKNMFALPK